MYQTHSLYGTYGVVPSVVEHTARTVSHIVNKTLKDSITLLPACLLGHLFVFRISVNTFVCIVYQLVILHVWYTARWWDDSQRVEPILSYSSMDTLTRPAISYWKHMRAIWACRNPLNYCSEGVLQGVRS